MTFLRDIKIDKSYVRFFFEHEDNDIPYILVRIPLTDKNEINVDFDYYLDYEELVFELINSPYEFTLDLGKIEDKDYLSSIVTLNFISDDKSFLLTVNELSVICFLYQEIRKLDKKVFNSIGQLY